MANFWDMVVQNNVQKVVTLCHYIGKGRDDDAYLYFPTEFTQKELKLQNGFTVTLGEVDESDHFVTRHFMVTRDGEEFGLKVEHTHFTSWPDWETPYDESMVAFRQIIDSSANFVTASYTDYKKNPDAEPKRLVVHCRAGIGRTGTTIACINLVIQIQKQRLLGNLVRSSIMVSPFSTVRQLREQRVSMCQTDNQYEYLFRFLKEYPIE